MAEVDGFWSALSWPQRQLKETVSGDEHEWFSPEGMPAWAYAAGNTALDLVADPLNLIPVGLFGKAAKAIPKGSQKGIAVSSAPNYIKNHYGLTDGPAQPSKAERAIMATMPNSMLDMEKLGLIRGARGKVEWAGEGMLNIAKAVGTPSGRALYADTGVNRGVQDTVARHLKSGGQPKAQSKAAANVNYNRHQNIQAGRTGDVAESMATIADKSNLESYAPNEPGKIAGWMEKHSGTKTAASGKPRKDNVTPKDAQFIENHVTDAWGEVDDVVMKRARSGTGGNHFNDLFKKSPFSSVAYQAFMKHGGEPNLRQLYDTVVDLQKKIPEGAPNKFRIKNPNWKDVEKNGLWLTGGIKGSAITEGGVNWLGKIEPSGKLTGVISDKHDFLDKPAAKVAGAINKIPGANVSPDITNRSLLAVTPPMKASIQSLRSKQFDKLGKPAKVQYSGIPTPKGGEKVDDVLKAYTEVRPTKETLQAERLRQAGMLTGGAALYQPNGEE